MSERNVAIGLVVLGVAALVAVFFYVYERREVDVAIPPSKEVRANDFLALERLLTSLDYDVSSRDEFAPGIALPPQNATAIMMSGYQNFNREQVEALLGWISAGGRLIVKIEPDDDEVDPLFTPLGVTASYRTLPDDDNDTDPDDNTEGAVSTDDANTAATDSANDEAKKTAPGIPSPTAAKQPGRDYWGVVRYDNGVSINLGDATPRRTVFDQSGVYAAEFNYDQGRLTVMADMRIFWNDRIALEDNAFILTQLLDSPSAGPVWLLLGAEYPTLWSLLKERLGAVMLGGLVVLGLWLWWASQRFGPAIPPPATARKSFLEHIEAAGRFSWRHKKDTALLHEVRESFLHEARRRHPTLRRGDEKAHTQYLAELSGLSTQDVRDSVFVDATGRSADFTHRIQRIKTLWKRL